MSFRDISEVLRRFLSLSKGYKFYELSRVSLGLRGVSITFRGFAVVVLRRIINASEELPVSL